MAESLVVDKGITLDLLDTKSPALSSTSDIPIVETKPDASPAPPEPPKTEPEAKAVEESEPQPEKPEDSSASPPKSKGVQKRIDELIKQREEERAEKLRLLALLEETRKIPPAPEPASTDDPEPVKPVRGNFPDPDAFEQALVDYADTKAAWTARREVTRALSEQERKQREEAVNKVRQELQTKYVQRVEKVKAKYADFDDVGMSPDVIVSPVMAEAIIQSDQGPEIQYYLGKNPNEAQRIRELPPHLQLMELGKLEVRLSTPAAATPPKPVISSAPAPVKPLTPAENKITKDPEEMSMDEYAAWRREQEKERRARH